ncbi:MAG: hypothetical protein LBS21_13005 [Clostridiales bacterium]|jgi:hypothetical protein|nr:hypothetical protein [Clostridiales bacterium]
MKRNFALKRFARLFIALLVMMGTLSNTAQDVYSESGEEGLVIVTATEEFVDGVNTPGQIFKITASALNNTGKTLSSINFEIKFESAEAFKITDSISSAGSESITAGSYRTYEWQIMVDQEIDIYPKFRSKLAHTSRPQATYNS